MAIRLTVEGDQCKVDRYLCHIQKDKRWKYYSPYEFLVSTTEKKVEYYIDESPHRMQEREKKRLATVAITTSGGIKIQLELLDVSLFDLNDGKTTLIGKSYDIYTDPLQAT